MGEKIINEIYDKHQKAILLGWHGSMMIPIMALENRGITVLVSLHDDGEIISRSLLKFGFNLVRGSSTRGGAKALIEMIKILNTKNNIITLTPDGPKGPHRELKLGAIVLAQRSGVPLIPMASYCNKPKHLKSWDNFLFVKPFSRCVHYFGNPVFIEKDLSAEQLEHKRKSVEEMMEELNKKVENYFN